MAKYKQVEFQGEKYILVEDALTTPKAFKAGKVSYAHVFDDGKIRRYGEVIGNADDLVPCGEVECNPKLNALIGLLGDSWDS